MLVEQTHELATSVIYHIKLYGTYRNVLMRYILPYCLV